MPYTCELVLHLSMNSGLVILQGVGEFNIGHGLSMVNPSRECLQDYVAFQYIASPGG